jgi:hypothetical protein
MRTMRELLAALLLVAAACFSTSALASYPVVIHHALADTAAGTLTLDGQNFGTMAGRVWLAKTVLSVQSWGDQQIVATLPAGTPSGSHLVTIQTAHMLPAFFVANLGRGGGAAGSIAGVVSACGTPVGHTLVYIPGRSFVVFTGASGAFSLDSVPPGTYDVTIETRGQPATTLTGVTVSADETTDTGTTLVVDLSSNPQHCGTCGNSCGTGAHTSTACVSGSCQPQTCELGWANCNGTLADGCEVHIQTNPANCGACGLSCLPGANCVANLCIGGPTPSPAACTTDAMCSPDQFCDTVQGRCQFDGIGGMPCTANSQCQSGNCQGNMCLSSLFCPAGMVSCGTGCIAAGGVCPP